MVQHLGDVVKIAGQSIERSTLTGLKTASAKSGVSFQYLVAKAAQESSLKTNAAASTSSAKGLFQFTRGTWLDMMNRHGERYGFGELAAKISIDAEGHAKVSDPAVERRILDLRQDPEASALMAAEYARGNATTLQNNLGRGADASDLYLTHFLGANGASQLLGAEETAPKTIAATLLPKAAAANKAVFYTAEGRARTVTEVADLIRDRFSNQMDRYAEVATYWGDDFKVSPDSKPRLALNPKSDFNVMDFRTNLTGSNSYAMAVSWMVLEEMAKLIASEPMNMLDGFEENETPEDPYAQTSPGFQGQEFATAFMQAMKSDADRSKGPDRANPSDHHRSAAAYEARFSPTAALRGINTKSSDQA